MPLYLVRHASAGHRDDSNPDDSDRPLDDTGTTQATKLAEWLSHEPIEAIVSSPYLRCVQTVTPLAERLALPISIDADLAEGASLKKSWQILDRLATTTAVVCSHGDVIPELIRAAQLRGLYVPGKSGCAKGSVWTLEHWDGDRFATGIYTPIPG